MQTGHGRQLPRRMGYHPLIVSLSNTQEILYVKNRSGNRPRHEGTHVYVDKSIKLLRKSGFKTISVPWRRRLHTVATSRPLGR
ncbi:MAG: hypothetical protein LBJ67_10490, partial [Planctomycetaceae bacterium]|nr:hypothetical protein [Planctomycetaceae bacterium]